VGDWRVKSGTDNPQGADLENRQRQQGCLQKLSVTAVAKLNLPPLPVSDKKT